jgi:hypothetical protein
MLLGKYSVDTRCVAVTATQLRERHSRAAELGSSPTLTVTYAVRGVGSLMSDTS